MNTGENGAAPAPQSVLAVFHTHTYSKNMPEQQFAVPITSNAQGLSALVNAILELEPPVPFDFILQDEYITGSLEKFMRTHSLSKETLLDIEYTPAIQAQEGSKLPHDDWVSSVRAPCLGRGELLLSGAYDHCVRLWHGEECLALGTGHLEAVKEVAVHPTIESRAQPTAPAAAGKTKSKKRTAAATVDVPTFTFVSASKDSSFRLWQCATNESNEVKITPLGSVSQHNGSVDTVDFSPNGEMLATGSWDKSIKLWTFSSLQQLSGTSAAGEEEAGTGETGKKISPIVSFDDHARGVLKVRFSPTRPLVYSAGLDGVIKMWNVEKAQLVSTSVGDHSIQALSIKPSQGGQHDMLLTGNTDNRLRLYDTRSRNVAKVWTGHRQWVYGVCWFWRGEEGESSEYETLLASSSEDATVRIWDLRSTKAALVTLDRLHTDGVLDVTYVGKGEIASGGKDNKMKTFRVQRSGS